ncbi:MAG: ParB/RepB/Spo0J family partition protein [Terracidiphilus sp.]|jgi:ParB family transcriptional regulator, chromosome partitioning protein
MTTSAADPKRRALGKGLDSLLPRVHATAAAAPVTAVANEGEGGGKPLEILLEQIDPNPYQTRTRINEDTLAELAASIAANGVIQPILVRPQADGRFQLIAGERRWRASAVAGKKTIPAILRQVSDEQAMEITIVENLQRADLNPMEQARAFDRLSREFSMTQEQMSLRTGKDRATIGNFLRLLKLPNDVQNRVETGELSFGHARALLGLQHHPGIEQAVKRVCALSLSVRQTENLVQSILFPDMGQKEAKPEPVVDPNVKEVAERLQRALGLRVRIEDKQGRGRVIIEYGKLEEFDALLEQLAGRE